ncbi:ankyrin repeat-containing domain protein [Lipomyces tetrasporus]|uniref:Ankyrin repeat-containing domain protein n=1 Tax=Lipomyces tetrasporus TaxID=54092 RepID=A0AAD7QSI5_9ASCO|nr:ankyrin repeat-containing domain protein [Lipomyces tetrasporus]KAJ8100488.1 ankyrin repeat-containing domain protein [Lipomyces tetrasporus]
MQTPSSRLRRAIISNSHTIVERLIRRFPDLLLNTDMTNGWTSLHYAAYHGHFEICVYLTLLGHDADEISLDTLGYTPLHLSALKNHEQTTHFLAQKFPHTLDMPTSSSKTVGYTPLILASKEGNDASVNILLDFGAEIDKSDSEGSRAIHFASEFGHKKVMKTLIERGADYKSSNLLGWTAMQYSFSSSSRSYLSAITLEVERRHDAELRQKALEHKLSLERPTATLSGHIPEECHTSADEKMKDLDTFNKDEVGMDANIELAEVEDIVVHANS